MGGFYANVTIKSPRADALDAVMDVMRADGVPAAVASDGNFVVVADVRLDQQDGGWLDELTSRLSAATGAPALGVMLHDDSLLIMMMARPGRDLHVYNSCPGYFDDAYPPNPEGGDAAVFADAFSAQANTAELEKILNAFDAEGGRADYPYVFESDRHRDVCQALGLPLWSVWFSWGGLKDAPPDQFDPSLLKHYGPF